MKIDQDVMVVLSTVRCEGNLAFLEGQLDRKLYLKVDKVLGALGGKWNRGKKAHVFDGDAATALDTAILTGEVTTHQDIGFFPTPPALAAKLVKDAGVEREHRCLEPSAGTGNIARAMREEGAVQIFVVERDRKMRDKLLVEGFLTLAIDGGEDDFLRAARSQGPFDRIVMNPPFLKCGNGDHLDHVMHAYSMLAPGGVLKSVLPSGVVFREDSRHKSFRAWARGLGGTFEYLPPGSFKSSGTGVNTVVLTIHKKNG